MGKKLVAITEIRHNEEIIPAGETLDASKFDKKQLESLYDAGAVRIEGNDDEKKPTTEEKSSTPVKSTPAPVVKEPTNAKGNSK